MWIENIFPAINHQKGANMTNLEIEVKFYLDNIEETRNRIRHAGGIFQNKEHENNIRFEDENDSLIKNGALLRLRQTSGNILLTYKGKVLSPASECKVYDEREVTVSDFDEMINILSFIGYKPVQRYEKIRETCRMGSALICLDEMPYGNFIEIEGDAAAIRKTAESLGFEWKNRILTNYLAIFETLKQAYNLDFNDVTFDNFKNRGIDFQSCLDLFTEG
jgi:adenylate cyclase, class 2